MLPVSALRAAPAFQGFSDEELDAIAPRMALRTLRPGEALDDGRRIGFLLQGSADVRLVRDDGRRVDLGPAQKGAILGLVGAMLGAHRYELVARDACTCAEIDDATLEAFLASGDSAALKLRWLLARALCRRLRAANDRLVSLAALPALERYVPERGYLG